jgi:divalent metal cation (Fe/Co/Zn/Cd) transporter
VALLLAYESKALLVGESAEAKVVAYIRAMTEADLAVERMMPPLTMHLGRHDTWLNLRIKFREELSAAEIGAAVDRIEKNIRRRATDIKRIFIEAESLSAARRQEARRHLE